MVDGDISAEVIATDFEGMVREGESLADIHENIVVKVPMTKDGIKAIRWFSDNGIQNQLYFGVFCRSSYIAAKAGATYLSPFIGRVDDMNWDGIELIAQIADIYTIQGFSTEILAASIRNPLHIVRAAEAGADVCTCPLSSI